MPQNKMANLVPDHTRENEGHEDLFVIKQYNGVNAKDTKHEKGEVYLGSMIIVYLPQMTGFSINTPTKGGIFMPFGHKVVDEFCS